jgi:hypothetical protein
MYRVRPIFQNGHFGEYSNSPKLANFRRVLEFDKFAGEWPLLSSNKTIHQPGTEGLAAKSDFGHKGINNGKDNLL